MQEDVERVGLDWQMAKVDSPNFRSGAKVCPSCEGEPVVSLYSRRKVCETCFGSGKVYPGKFCQFCGRSIQYEYKNVLICGSATCEELAKKRVENKPATMFVSDREEMDSDALMRFHGLIM